jgi:glutamate carboxypeptidase
VAVAGFSLDRFLRDLERLVNRESKTGELAALTACAELLLDVGGAILGPRAVPLVTETIDGPVVQWRIGGPPYRVGLVGHYDTVHPLGSLVANPFRVDGDIVHGPGTFDMKAGILTLLHGVAEAPEQDGVLVHLCPDEEIGSPSSVELLRIAVADGLRHALVYEGAGPDGAVYSQRKGGLWMRIRFNGRDAHASRPHEGLNALQAMGAAIMALPGLAAPALGTTVVPTQAAAGTAINTAPGTATLVVDCRALTADEHARVLGALEATAGPDADVEVMLRVSPFEDTSSQPVLAALARAGLTVPGLAIGNGISDANHLAGLGIAVIDGLGPEGGLDHSPHEWVRIGSIADRVQLTAALLPALSNAGTVVGER